MPNRKIENPLVDNMARFSANERLAIIASIALIVAGISGAIISRVACREEKKPKSGPSLKVCTPEEKVKVQKVLKRAVHATGDEVKLVLSELDAILEKELDCGWENVRDAHENLESRFSFRRQP